MLTVRAVCHVARLDPRSWLALAVCPAGRQRLPPTTSTGSPLRSGRVVQPNSPATCSRSPRTWTAISGCGTPDGPVRFDGTRFQKWAPSGGSARAARPGVGDRRVVAGRRLGRLRQRRAWRASIAAAPPTTPRPTAHRPTSTRFSKIVAARCGPRPSTGCSASPATAGLAVTEADGYDGEQAFSVYEDRAGRVWVGAARGLYRHDGTRLHLVDSTATYVDSLVEDDAGNLWVTDRAAIVRKIGTPSAGARSIHASASRCQAGASFRRTAADCWSPRSAAACSGIADPSGARPLLEPVEYEHRLRGSPRALYRDRDDNIWVGMRGGLLRLSENTFQYTGPLDGLNRDGVRTAAVAADGSIWIATTQALNRLADGQPAIVRDLTDARAVRRSLGGDVGGDRRDRRAATRWGVSSGSGYRTSRPAG